MQIVVYVSIRQHALAYVSICQHTSAYASIRPHMSAYVSICQHTSAEHLRAVGIVAVGSWYEAVTSRTLTSPRPLVRHESVARCSIQHRIRQHTSAYGSIRQHASAYVSIRQHTAAYVSIRQHMPLTLPTSDTRARGALQDTYI